MSFGPKNSVWTSSFLRINDEGKLVGRHLDFFGSTDLHHSRGMHVPNASSLEDIRISDSPETELGVDFCLTWNIDPRWDFIGIKLNRNPHLRTKLVPPNKTSTLEPSPDSDCSDKRSIACWRKYQDNKKKYIEEEFVQSGPVRLLEAVYCDPCKAKVFNSGDMNSQSASTNYNLGRGNCPERDRG